MMFVIKDSPLGKNPTEIVDNFFKKQQENFSEEDKINLL